MGNKISTFTDDQLEAYQDCTFFTRKEILRIFTRYQELAPNLIPYDMTGDETSQLRIPYETIESMSELKENPFRRRICEVFSEDSTGDMTFDDFLDMFSVFCEAAPREIKTVYAFRIYDFDCDNYIGRGDLQKTLRCLSRNELSDEEVDFVVDKILEEADLDDDNMLSYVEFEHVISRAPDFIEPGKDSSVIASHCSGQRRNRVLSVLRPSLAKFHSRFGIDQPMNFPES